LRCRSAVSRDNKILAILWCALSSKVLSIGGVAGSGA
jgi:hypothetical protein